MRLLSTKHIYIYILLNIILASIDRRDNMALNFEDRKGRTITSEELNELDVLEIEALGIHATGSE
jgi:hypothetical protein